MNENPEETFKRLRPTCVKLSKQPTRQAVQELRDSLEFVDAIHLDKLTEYILFPLHLTLQRPGLSNELKQDAVSCIEAVIYRTKVQKLNIFSDLFNALTVLVSDKEPGKVAKVSEELKLATINCLNCLLESSGLVIRSVLYRPKLLPSLGHAISILLDVLQHEKSRELKIAALKCLKVISFCNYTADISENETLDGSYGDLEESERHDMYVNIRHNVSDAMTSFLPGISMAFSKVVTGDSNQGHVIITMAIDIWGAVVSMVMNDSCLSGDLDDNDDIMIVISSLAKIQTNDIGRDSNVNGGTESNEFSKSKNLKVVKTKEWFKTTGLKLKVLFEKLTCVASCHSNWKVRLSLLDFCENVLSNCTDNLSCCTSLLVDVLVGSLEDEYSQVASRSKVVLDSLAKNQDKRGKESFDAILEENLHSQLTALPRIMRTADDINKERALNLLNGYMTLLDDRITTILSSSSHLKRLSLALVQILELDTSDVGIVEERTPDKHESAVIPSDTLGENPMSVDTDTIQASQYPRYRFRHFRGDKICHAIRHSCQLLGYHGNLSLLVDYFLDLFHESKVHRKQAVYILNEIVVGFASREKKGASRENQELLLYAVKLLLPSYTSEKTWNLPTSISQQDCSNPPHRHNPSISYQSLNSNILLTCLLLEGIGIFAHSLGDHFNPLLIDTLYLVLAKLGDNNAAISRSAYGTLVMISKSCGYTSVEDLITHNADYLVNSIALDLKYVFINEQAPQVLRVMLQYSNKDILTIIEDTINDVFSVMDLYPDQLIHSLVKVLHALVCAICQWFTGKEVLDQKPQKTPQVREEKFSQKAVGLIQAYMKSKRIALGNVSSEDLHDINMDNNDINVGDDEDFYKPDEKPEIPLHVKYATEVLEKCIHFLSSSSPVLRILVLDTVYHGVLSLRERENDLLPMIHRLWLPLVNRLTDKDQVVIAKAIHVVASMSECSGDFMKRRVIKDVFPKLQTLLEQQSYVSLKAGPIYTQSQSFKLQLAALQGLGRLCKQLTITEHHLYGVASVCCLYLSNKQPDGLQKDAVAAFDNFIQVDPDVVWLVLNNIYCPALPKPPHRMFTELNLVETGPEAKEYAANVLSLLEKLNY